MSEAGTVAEALKGLAQRPDWILLDLMLPDGDGTAVLRKTVMESPRSRTCVISGCGPVKLHEARTLGAAHVFTKPLDVERLLGVLLEAAPQRSRPDSL